MGFSRQEYWSGLLLPSLGVGGEGYKPYVDSSEIQEKNDLLKVRENRASGGEDYFG